MPSSSAFADEVVALLTPLGPVRARRMFGGWGIYHEDLMFALIAWDRLFFRTDEATKDRFAEAGSEPFVYDGKGKPVEMPYWEAPAGSLETPDTLLPWGELGLKAARRVRKAKKGRKRKKSARG